MSAREDILARLRAHRAGGDGNSDAHVRLETHPAGPSPARAQGHTEEIRNRFVAMARKASAEVEALAGIGALPALLARIAGEHGLEPAAAIAPDPALEALDWRADDVHVQARAAAPDDRICVSHALCGVAETGTLVLRSGADSPVTLNFLPEIHVVALAGSRLVGGYEQAWARVRAAGPMPRTVNWITGPSRSADIEQTIQLGAHGPVRLVLALY